MVAEAASDMSPQQEESVKAPLTGESVAIQVKDDGLVTGAPTNEKVGFQGLTKDELMEYANKPFWKRLRIFLMVLFWAAWVAMLVIAILVIINAPRCPPPPSSTWLEQNAMLELDVDTPVEDATNLLNSLDIESLYVPELISDEDYQKLSSAYSLATIMALFQAVTSASTKIVTDFVPSPIKASHVWTQNATYSKFYNASNMNVNYNGSGVETELEKVFKYWQEEYNVTGFLVREEDQSNQELLNLTETLNDNLNPEIAFGMKVDDMTPVLGDLSDLKPFAAFVLKDMSNDTYYKVHPVQDKVDEMKAVLLALMTLSGTPIMQVNTAEQTAFALNYTSVIKEGVSLRQQDAFKWGEVLFANTTAPVLAYTRTLKGTPGYAVVINLDATTPATVDMSAVAHVPTAGTIHWEISEEERDSNKLTMSAVPVAPLNGLIIQFVADYSG